MNNEKTVTCELQGLINTSYDMSEVLESDTELYMETDETIDEWELEALEDIDLKHLEIIITQAITKVHWDINTLITWEKIQLEDGEVLAFAIIKLSISVGEFNVAEGEEILAKAEHALGYMFETIENVYGYKIK